MSTLRVYRGIKQSKPKVSTPYQKRPNPIQDAFERYLSDPAWDWTWFVTGTYDPAKFWNKYREEVYIPRTINRDAWSKFNRLVADGSSAHWGWMFEEQHQNGRPHWHGLIHVSPNLAGLKPLFHTVWSGMYKSYGRFEIKPYQVQHKDLAVTCIASYLTKYVAKEARNPDNLRWDFAGSLSGSEADAREILDACGVKNAAFSGL